MGFRYRKESVSGCDMLVIKDCIDDLAAKEILNGEYESLWLYWGGFERMSELVSQKQLACKYLRLQCDESQDVSWVSSLTSLELLLLKGKTKGVIDFTSLASLSSLTLDFNKTTIGVLDSCFSLDSLSISSFNKTLGDFDSRVAESISTLGLSGGSLTDLKGLEKFKNLKGIVLTGMRKLVDIEGLLKCESLEHIDIESCNSIESLECLQELNRVEEIFFGNRMLPSLSLFPKKSLKYVRLEPQVKIVDCKIEKFLEFPALEKVTFTKKKGYKNSAAEINDLLSQKG